MEGVNHASRSPVPERHLSVCQQCQFEGLLPSHLQPRLRQVYTALKAFHNTILCYRLITAPESLLYSDIFMTLLNDKDIGEENKMMMIMMSEGNGSSLFCNLGQMRGIVFI